ncbi:MAG: NFACT RNA binding domain-containing protein [Treponema sp.]|jgi:predicted ribosome quality control (RQC) complex YloA/Tae2 family protein|nr:NFACT RNA binding domain-containing protein [Treponema sp.]
MSLNWKEINLILSELDLPGSQIQKVYQSAYDVLTLQLFKGRSFLLLIALTPGACRLHETFQSAVKGSRPLRFAEFCKSRIINGWIEEAFQLGDNRIVRLTIRQGKNRYHCYLRLWSNAANVIVTDETGTVLDAMRRSPKRGEISGGHYEPADGATGAATTGGTAAGSAAAVPKKEYSVRELPGPGSFNQRIDAWYAEHGGALSLEALREQARRSYEGSMGRLELALERLRAKEAEYEAADRLKEYGDIIMANLAQIKTGDSWLEAENFYAGGTIRIKLDPKKKGAAQAEAYYEQYRKAKNGFADVQGEIAAGEAELSRLRETLGSLLRETNPLVLHLRLKNKGPKSGVNPGLKPTAAADRKRPGLSFRRKDWLIIVGRDAAENDALLRRHVKGRDMWLHVRDFPGSYVFIKQRSGKTVPLDILLDAGNLALFYSKGRNNGEADLFYTEVKFLRRAKNGPKGLVLPTQEKNLHIKADSERLKELEKCRIEK